MRSAGPLSWLARWIDRFEERGVYVPGEDSGSVRPWREFSWLITLWILGVAVFVLFFAVAG